VKLIVGLGNPGIEFQFTLHNLGFLAVDRLAAQCGTAIGNRRCRALTGKAEIAGVEVLLAKPETYMNLSGISVRGLVEELGSEPGRDLIVLYDDLDLPFGAVRVRKQGGAGGHHGMESVIGALDTKEFTRVRMGISPGHKVADGAHYVLSPIRKSQHQVVDEMLDTAGEAVKAILAEGPNAAMNRFNRKARGLEDAPESASGTT
jgi:PTH1 family peptidyl-tRNA hydrolase